MGVQQWKSQVVRWHQLSRYYANKWQYDGAKWAERIWFGTGTTVPNAVASVPFMITRNMRAQLEGRGFPAHAISALLPKDAHQLINDNVTYAQFQTQRALDEAEQKQQEQQQQEAAVEEIKEIVATIHAREKQKEQTLASPSTTPTASQSKPPTTNQIAIVPDAKQDATATQERL